MKFLACCYLLALLGCERNTSLPSQERVAEAAAQRADAWIAKLQTRIALLEVETEDLRATLSALNSRHETPPEDEIIDLEWLERVTNSPSFTPAVLQQDPRAYAFSDSKAGKFLVYFVDSTPMENRQKVRIKVCNPLSISFVGFDLRIEYHRLKHPVFDAGDFSDFKQRKDAWEKEIRAWTTELHRSDRYFIQELPAGKWVDVEFVLDISNPQEMSYLAVNIEPERIRVPK